MNGIEIVDKPLGKTSFDMVSKIRKKYNIKKVGHIGTLDPMATGVLVILVGEATKLSDYLVEHDKEYIATIYLGEKTDTGDSEGKVIEKKEVTDNISKEKVENVLNSFLGKSNQIPPMYSAIKVNGKKLYELARKGEEVKRLPREIEITEINLISINNNTINFRVVCSKGTYIRTLCEDIAEKLGTVGYMKSLRRTRIGNFKIEDAGKFILLEEIFDRDIKVEENDVKKIINGVKIAVKEKDGLVNLYNDKKYLGIGEIKNHILKRKIIIN